MRCFTADQMHGARSLVRDGLKITTGLKLLLLYQEDLSDAAECIQDAAAEFQVSVEPRIFKQEDFLGSQQRVFPIEKLINIVPRPNAIALLIEWSEETTRARLAFIKDLQNAPNSWRIASMPGVDLEGLAWCISDFPDINKNCLAVFAAMARASSANLDTLNPFGDMDRLEIHLGRGGNLPIISTGEINVGTWGNFPSGETFIVPDEYAASGWVTVRGSIPSRPFMPDEWVRFSVTLGRMDYKSINSSSQELREEFIRLFFNSAGEPKAENTNALAELGVGTNSNIAVLTGKPIFDEKKLGTVSSHLETASNSGVRYYHLFTTILFVQTQLWLSTAV